MKPYRRTIAGHTIAVCSILFSVGVPWIAWKYVATMMPPATTESANLHSRLLNSDDVEGPDKPARPILSSIATSTLVVTLPRLPSHTRSLTLERITNDARSWSEQATDLSGGATVIEMGLNGSETYIYRVVAVSDYGETPGDWSSANLARYGR